MALRSGLRCDAPPSSWSGSGTTRSERINAFLDSGCIGTAEQVIAELRFFIDRGAELIILWFQDLSTVGSGDSMAERFMQRAAPVLR